MANVSQLPNGRIQFVDATGAPLVGGQVFYYVPGTLTPSQTWQDSQGLVLNANPITLDALGSCSVWGSGSYRQVLLDALGNQLWDVIVTAPALSTGVLLVANNLSDVASASSSRSNLGLGTAAVVNTGTAGATIPLNNGANTFSGAGVISGALSVTGQTTITQPGTINAKSIGYLGVPQNIQTTNYTLALSDAGGEVFVGGNYNITIPTNASVAFPIGSIINMTWDASYSGTLAGAGGVTLRWPVGNVTSTRTITGPGMVTIKQEKANEWWIAGGVNIT